MDIQTFEAGLRSDGFQQIETKEVAAGTHNSEHAPPVEARAPGLARARWASVTVHAADLESDPAEYAVLWAPALDGKADVVFGSRFQSSRPHRVLYFWHSMGNRLLTLASNMFTGLNLSDMETCYKLFRREVIQSITI